MTPDGPLPSRGRLADRTALVTGASRGLGAAIAKALAREGASVAINYRVSADAAQSVRAEIEQAGGRAICVQADCTDEDAVREMVDRVARKLGPVRILVNNAGTISFNRIEDMPLAQWEEMMASHVRSHFLVTRACLPGMRELKPISGERRTAKVINMSSCVGQRGGRGTSTIVHYVTAKAAVLGFTKALAQELAPAIAVNAIAPGSHPTDMTMADGRADAWREEKEREVLLGVGTVEDVAETAVFLASGVADYYTGQTLAPNGGDVMNG